MYKIVRTVKNKKYSLATIKQAMIEYKIKEWVYPTVANSLLFVFEELVFCEEYLAEYSTFREKTQIWECEVQDPIPATTMYWGIDYWAMAYYWKYDRSYKAVHAPLGTYLASAVKLTNRVV